MLYKGLVDTRVPLFIVVEDSLDACLFSESKATIVLLQFIGSANLFWDKD